MNNPNTKSSIFNMSGATLATVTWIVALLSSFGPLSFLVSIACIGILLFERESDYFRNHVSQVLALSIVYTLIDIMFYLLFGGSGLFLFAFLRFLTSLVVKILRLVLVVLKIAFYLIGLSKSLDKKEVQIPFIGSFGYSLERSITPESL